MHNYEAELAVENSTSSTCNNSTAVIVTPKATERRKSKAGSFIATFMPINEGDELLGKDGKQLLSLNHMRKGLQKLGVNPITLQYAFQHINLSSSYLTDIGLLVNYPLLLTIDISDNLIENINVLENIPMLTSLFARKNKITSCLDYHPPKCTPQKSWSNGGQSVGSMLTYADLAENLIDAIGTIDQHCFLEYLNLSHNSISIISGIKAMKFLIILDLSFNKLQKLTDLDYLNIEELNIEGNELRSLEGLSKLNSLRKLNASRNSIQSLSPLSISRSLQLLDISHNKIRRIRDLDNIKLLPNLVCLSFTDNPCCVKHFYRLRCLYILPNLLVLDHKNASPTEKLDALNLYKSDKGELPFRQEAHFCYFPDEPFTDYSCMFNDDEECDVDCGIP